MAKWWMAIVVPLAIGCGGPAPPDLLMARDAFQDGVTSGLECPTVERDPARWRCDVLPGERVRLRGTYLSGEVGSEWAGDPAQQVLWLVPPPATLRWIDVGGSTGLVRLEAVWP